MARTKESETRFQQLPSTEEWDSFKSSFEEIYKSSSGNDEEGGKIIVLDQTEWFNSPTRTKQKVYNIPIYATTKTSDYPKAINKITKYEFDDENLSKVKLISELGHNLTKTEWVFNPHYGHININSSHGHTGFCIYRTKEEIEDIKNKNPNFYDIITRNQLDLTRNYPKIQYEIDYQDVCAPIKQRTFYTMPLDKLKGIFQAQLQGQNAGSSFQNVDTVANGYNDFVVRTTTYSTPLKQSAPIIQLVTELEDHNLREMEVLRDRLSAITLPKDDKEVLVKYIGNTHYKLASVEELEEKKSSISTYYPILTYDMLKDLTNNLPKIEIDVACIGLGSAGTGILDQVSRSNFFRKYLIVDFDTVEYKNLRNQWYTRTDVGAYKTSAARNTLEHNFAERNERINVISRMQRYEDLPKDTYTCKYLISGFDSIECRLGLLEKTKEKDIEARYLLDARYDELASSLFFIDLQDEAQVKYYENGLKSDLEAFKAIEEEKNKDNYIDNYEDFIKYLESMNIFNTGCLDFHKNFLHGAMRGCEAERQENSGMEPLVHGCTCHNDKCLEHFKKMWEEHHPTILRQNRTEQQESSCVRRNFIDIYKFSSTFFFTAIREIEAGNAKPFTHIEAQTDVLPSFRVFKK